MTGNRPTGGYLLRRLTLGSGPLKRGSDRLEFLARVLLVCCLVTAIPIALAVGTATHTRAQALADAQAVERPTHRLWSGTGFRPGSWRPNRQRPGRPQPTRTGYREPPSGPIPWATSAAGPSPFPPGLGPAPPSMSGSTGTAIAHLHRSATATSPAEPSVRAPRPSAASPWSRSVPISRSACCSTGAGPVAGRPEWATVEPVWTRMVP